MTTKTPNETHRLNQKLKRKIGKKILIYFQKKQRFT